MSFRTKVFASFAIVCIVLTMIYSSPQDIKIVDQLSKFWRSIVLTFVSEIQRNPFCENILHNLTNGRWEKRIFKLNENDIEYKELVKQEEELDKHLIEFRIKRGIHTRLWRDDGKCGYKNVQAKPKGNAWAAPAGSWCDAKSEQPCCSDVYDGNCGSNCDCPKCADLRKVYHAEISDWIPFDSSCRQRNYTSVQSCDVVNRFSQIHFVGDSFVRKMSRGFVLTLRSDPTYGFLLKKYDQKFKELCVGLDQFYWTECRTDGGYLLNKLVNETQFCGERTPSVVISSFYNNGFANQFLELVKSLTDKKGTVILLGLGGHDGCKSQTTIQKFLHPAIDYLEKYYQKSGNVNGTGKKFKKVKRWPHIVFMYPDTNGLLKPMAYHAQNGNVVCGKFSQEMKVYCDAHNIPVLDFSKVTSGVHSYDGAHHGLGVNIVKVQLLLNYLDYIS